MPIHVVWDHVLSSGYVSFQARMTLSEVSRNLHRRLLADDALLEGVIYENFSGQTRYRFWKWSLQRRIPQPHLAALPSYQDVVETDDASNCNTTGQMGEIMRDVHRTFPSHPFFSSGAGEKILARVLRSVARSTPVVGYCQGMNFVAGALLLSVLPSQITGGLDPTEPQDDTCSPLDLSLVQSDHFDEIAESEIYQLMILLIDLLGPIQLESIWRPGVPKMKLRVYQFDRLLKWNLPCLYEHLSGMSISSEIIVSQWFMTLFSYTIPLSLTVHIWDYIFLGGWPAIFKVTLGILRVLEDTLLAMDIEAIGLLLRDWKRGKFNLSCDSHEVLRVAHRYGVTESTLMSLQEAYAIEIMTSVTGMSTLGGRETAAEEAHPPGGVSWLLRFGDVTEEMEEDLFRVQNDLQNMDVQVEHDKMFLQRKIISACEACERSYEQLAAAQRDENLWMTRVAEINKELNTLREKVKLLALEIGALSEPEVQVDQTMLTTIEPLSLVEIERLASEEVMVMDESLDEACVYMEEENERDVLATEAESPVVQTTSSTESTGSLLQRVMSFGKSRSESQSEVIAENGAEVSDISPGSSPSRRYQRSGGPSLVEKLKSHPQRRRHDAQINAKPSASWMNMMGGNNSRSELDTDADSSLFKASLQSGISPAANTFDDAIASTQAPVTEPRVSPLSLPGNQASGAVKAKPNLRLKILRDSVGLLFKATGLTNFLAEEEVEEIETGEEHPAEQSFESEAYNSEDDDEVVSLNTSSASKKYADAIMSQPSNAAQLTKELKTYQRIIVNLTKKLDYANKKLREFAERKSIAALSDEEARQWKESLCEQFQLLVQDWTRGRSQKLQYITDTYGI